MRQLDLEAINAKLRGAVIEELVTNADPEDETVTLSFVDDTPDLVVRPIGDDLAGASLCEIGRVINRDHTTVLNALRRSSAQPKDHTPPYQGVAGEEETTTND